MKVNINPVTVGPVLYEGKTLLGQVQDVSGTALFSYDVAQRMMEHVHKWGPWLTGGVTVTSALQCVKEAMAATPTQTELVSVFQNPTAMASLKQMAVPAMAAAKTSGLWAHFLPLVHMVQDFALPVGVIVATWGLIEIIIGNVASGKEKLKYSIIGYIGIFIIPMIFEAIRAAFQGV